MKAIGGYFGLELPKKKEYYSNLIRLNSGRNCLEYILRIRNYKKIYIPYYTCEVVLEPFTKLGIEFKFYHNDQKLKPIIDFKIKKDEAILVNNYFGITGHYVEEFAHNFNNVIVDNSQAFYFKPMSQVDTFYSPRKFFGIPDGGYLSINKIWNTDLEQDLSYERMSHLLKRIEFGPEEGYEDFKKNDKALNNQQIKKMSELTKRILSSINYSEVKKIRNKNFNLLHEQLKDINELQDLINESQPINGPMVYPLMITNDEIREYLIKNKIYVATYWPNVFNWVDENSIEYKLAKYLLPLPIDQRYEEIDMKILINVLKGRL